MLEQDRYCKVPLIPLQHGDVPSDPAPASRVTTSPYNVPYGRLRSGLGSRGHVILSPRPRGHWPEPTAPNPLRERFETAGGGGAGGELWAFL